MEQRSMKETLLQDAEDMEGILQQMGRTVTAGRGPDDPPLHALVALLAQNHDALSSHLSVVDEFSQRERLIEKLEAELKVRDDYLRKLQTCLKDSESLLISAIFQANQKLKLINQANKQKVAPEDLIKYAHSISKTNAVAAPLTWQQGDPERPYPTDVEMRKGHLARKNETGQMEVSGMLPPSLPPQGGAVPSPHLTSALIGGPRPPMPYSSPRQGSPGPGQFPMMSNQPGGQRHMMAPMSGFGSPQNRMPASPGAGGPGFPSSVFPQNQGSSLAAVGGRPPPPYPGASPRGGWSGGPVRSNLPGAQMSSPSLNPVGQPGVRRALPPGFAPRQGTPPVGPTGAVSSPRTFGPGGGPAFPPQVNPYLGGPIAGTHLRQRRPQAPGQRIMTPPIQAQTRLAGPKQGGNAPEVETVSSDSSSSSSSENNSPA